MLRLAGTMTNGGTIEFQSANSNSGGNLWFAGNTTLAGNGAIEMKIEPYDLLTALAPNSTLTNSATHTIRGAGRITSVGQVGIEQTFFFTLANAGLIDASVAGKSLSIVVRESDGGRVNNTGILRASGGGNLSLSGNGVGFVNNAGGTVEALDNSTVTVNSNATVEGGTLATSGSGTIRAGNGKLSNVTNTGRVVIGLNQVLRAAGTITNNGTIEFQSNNPNGGGNFWFAGDTTLSGNGAIEMKIDPWDLITALAPNSTLTNTATHTIRGAGRITSVGQVALEQTFFFAIANAGLIDANVPGKSLSIVLRESDGARVNNTGTLRASGGGKLSFSGNSGVGFVTNNGGLVEALSNSTILFDGNAAFVQTAGTIDLNGGVINAPRGLDLNGGLLIGNGTFNGPIRNNGGKIDPGHSPGTITVNGAYTQGANGTMDMEIGGAAAGTGYDRLVVNGTATLGGTLNIAAINGFSPAVGDIFTLISASSFTGNFATVNISGFTGVIDSSSAGLRLTVTNSPRQLLNISTRLRVLAGDNALIGGFIVTGSEPKKVLIRGLGSSLPVPGPLANPTLELFDVTGASLATNDDWRDTQQSEIEATTIPPTNDLESALVRTLAPGNYTAVLRGKNNGTGVGLVEVYDLTAAGLSHLANISTRGFVDTGDNVMIGGVIIGEGSTGAMARIIVRAIGPSLAAAGVSGALQDPMLELRNANGSLVAQNDDWRSDQEQAIIATTVPPTDNREAAIVATLPAGNYTAVLRGKNNTTGVALVEAYNLN